MYTFTIRKVGIHYFGWYFEAIDNFMVMLEVFNILEYTNLGLNYVSCPGLSRCLNARADRDMTSQCGQCYIFLNYAAAIDDKDSTHAKPFTLFTHITT